MVNKKIIPILVIGILIIAGGVLIVPNLNSPEAPAETDIAQEIPATGIKPAGNQIRTEGESEGDLEENEVVLPTPRQDLQSTDPESVDLAAGKLQLIELFAFW